MKLKVDYFFRNMTSKRAGLCGAVLAIVFLLGSTVLLTKISQGNRVGSGDFSGVVQFNPQPKPQNLNLPPPKKSPPPKPNIAPPKLEFRAQGLSFGLKSLEENFGFLGKGLGSDQLVMTEDTVDTPPKRRGGPPLEYPTQARNQGIQGHVLVKLLINSKGHVEKVEIKQSEPVGIFEGVVLAASKAWSFEPAQYQGRQVATWVEQKIHFNLN